MTSRRRKPKSTPALDRLATTYQHLLKYRAQVAALTPRVATLEHHNAALLRQIHQMQETPRTIRRVVRQVVIEGDPLWVEAMLARSLVNATTLMGDAITVTVIEDTTTRQPTADTFATPLDATTVAVSRLGPHRQALEIR